MTKLHVDSVQYDYPLGMSKAFANKTLCSWAAHFLADTTVPQLQRPAVMMCSLMKFNHLLEQNGLFFNDDVAIQVYNHGLLYCQLHVLAAYDALEERRPRWKVRPPLHSLVCEIFCKLANGSRLNPKVLACWSDEDYIGQSCAIGKSRCVHPTTLGLRMLQRLVLTLNAELTRV